MTKRKKNPYDRKKSNSFLRLFHSMIQSPEFEALSSNAKDVLLAVAARYRGTNNGNLAAEWSYMQKHGFSSRATVTRGLKELVSTAFFEITQHGWHRRPTLFALTWEPVDEIEGKPEIIPTRTASNAWKKQNEVPHGEALPISNSPTVMQKLQRKAG